MLVLSRIARDDEAASPAHEFIQAKVFEMAAIAEINVPARAGRQSQQFAHESPCRDERPGARPRARVDGVAAPPAEPHVEDRHQERQGGRAVIPHVGAGGGAGYGKGNAQPCTLLVHGPSSGAEAATNRRAAAIGVTLRVAV